MLSISVKDVLDRARFYLNDLNATMFTDGNLFHAFKPAYDDLKEELYDHNIQITNAESEEYVITTDMRDIGGPTGPALPANLVVPMEVWERLAGTDDDYSLMGQRRYLPKTSVLSAYLQYWSYRKQYIEFLGATTNRDVKIDYVGDTLTFTTSEDSRINLFNAKSFLSYRTGALAAEFFGEDEARAEKLNNNAGKALDKLLNTDIKNQQSMPVRRRPFMARYKRTGGPYF